MDDPYSASKALYHVDKLKLLQENKPISPTLLQVDLEAFCNDNCIFCSYRKENGYNTDMLKLITIQGIAEDRNLNKPIGRPTNQSGLPEEFADKLPKMMKEASIPAIELTGGGEPTIWKHFDKLLTNLINEGIEIGLVTNGSNLSDERIGLLAKNAVWVRLSMDSSNSALHQIIHRTPNSDFQRRSDNIRKLVQKKKEFNSNITIGISFIITPQNYEDVVKSVVYYKKLGVNNIRFSWMYDKEGTGGLTDSQIEVMKSLLSKLKEMVDEDDFKMLFSKERIDNFSRPNDDFSECFMQRFVWALGADCKIYPCCIVKYMPEYALGDLREKTLKEMIEFSHDKMNKLNVKTCPPCWLRDRNKSMTIAIIKPAHLNFI